MKSNATVVYPVVLNLAGAARVLIRSREGGRGRSIFPVIDGYIHPHTDGWIIGKKYARSFGSSAINI